MQIVERNVENIIVGSGAAGLSCAVRLYQCGERDTAIVTENMNAGTSRNTGSDKQTYYKLSIAGADPDSVQQMAEDLFAGGCVDGDQALCEAALSVRCYCQLVELGVPFPCNEFGEYMGYKTDHDRGRRATSAGPYTSRMMTECLERRVRELGIPVYDGMQMIRLLVEKGTVYGVLCLDRNQETETYCIYWCRNVVLATGGPAGMYHDSVYPASQLGASGTAFQAGVIGKNLTEWQFGMASLRPRWNVSGTYMQALPTMISTNADGTDEREFLLDYFRSPAEMLSQVFMKGYQWPFDVNKIYGGSSIIDLLVYQETILRGRRVYLDYMINSAGREIPFDHLSEEARQYLENAGAAGGRPIDRLRIMNEPAIAFYQDHGIDLASQRLEIAICAQHNNGGMATNDHWETNIHGLFAIGELNGSHGVTRPGGTALNAGQVGAVRAADRIHLRRMGEQETIRGDLRWQGAAMDREAALRQQVMQFLDQHTASGQSQEQASDIGTMWRQASLRMSAVGGMIRNRTQLAQALKETEELLLHYPERIRRPTRQELPLYYRLYDMLFSQMVYLHAMVDYMDQGLGSRGSALYTNEHGERPDERLPELYCCRLDRHAHDHLVQEVQYRDGQCEVRWRPVRPIPDRDDFFENQWRAYRNRYHILTTSIQNPE